MRNHADPPPAYYDPPEAAPFPRCPICGEESDTFYKNGAGEICGCDVCIKAVDAWDYVEDDE